MLSLMPGNSVDSIQHKQSKSNSKVAKQGANKGSVANSNKPSASNGIEGTKNDAAAGQATKATTGRGKNKGGKKTALVDVSEPSEDAKQQTDRQSQSGKMANSRPDATQLHNITEIAADGAQ